MAPSREIEKLQRRWQENPLGLTFAPLAEAYRKEGMYEDALELLSIGLAQHPNYVPAHIVRGRCYVDSHTDAAAEASFQRVTELDPENVIALKGLADLAEKSGRVDEAIARLERLLEFDRNNDDARSQFERLRVAQAQAQVQAAAEEAAAVVDPVAAEAPSIEAPAAVEEPPVEVEALPAASAEADGLDQPAEEGRAAVVDISAGEVEVVTYRPLELVAAADSEYQLADDAAALGAQPAEPVPDAEQADPGLAEPAVSAESSVTEPVAVGADAVVDGGDDAAEAPTEVAAEPQVVEPAIAEPAIVEASVPTVPTVPEVAQVPDAAVPEPAVSEPAVAELAVVSDEAAVESTAAEPVADEPEAGTSEPLQAEQLAEAPAVEIPAVEAPVAEAPVAEAPAAEAPAAEAPAVEAPVVEAVVGEDHVAETLATEISAAEVSAAEIPAVEASAVESAAEDGDNDVAFDVDPLDPEQDDAEAVAGFEAEPDLVVTETMAELFLRQGHRALALAVYTQLSEREQDNPRIRGAIEQLQAELRPGSSVGIPAFAAVLTGGQSVRAFFEHLLAATRPAAPDRQEAGLSLGAVFGEEPSAAAAPAPVDDRGPSYDEFFAEEQPPAELPKRPDREGAAVDAAAEDLEHFTSWLKGLKR